MVLSSESFESQRLIDDVFTSIDAVVRFVAANHLVPAFEAGADPRAVDAATESFQRERYSEVETIQRMQAVPPRFVFGGSWWARAGLALVPLLVRLQALGIGGPPNAVIDRFAFGVDDVELRV